MKVGRILDPTKPKASPYIVTDLENRLMLVQREDVQSKLLRGIIAYKSINMGGAGKYYNGILRLY